MSASGQRGQIPLPFSTFDALDFNLYLTGANVELQTMLQQTAEGTQRRSVYLWGGEGTGKSHLLQAACKRAAEHARAVAYIPLRLFSDQPSAVLDGLDQQQLVCVDDAQLIRDNRQWEEALFHLYNRLHDHDATMIISATVAPDALNLSLPDLASRFSWGLVYQLQELTDEEKFDVLQQRADARGFSLSNEVIDYLKVHARRDMSFLMTLLDRIDESSIIEQRKITVPFVKKLI